MTGLERLAEVSRELEAQAGAVRALAARYVVADIYDTHRMRESYDMAGGRRRRAIDELERELNRARRAAREAGIRDEDLIATPDEVHAAVNALARRMLNRNDVRTNVVAAIAQTVYALNAPVPDVLAAAQADERPVYHSGGSRTSGRRRDAYRR